MRFRNLFTFATSAFRSSSGRRTRNSGRYGPYRLAVERLESRSLLTAYTITDLNSLAGLPGEARDLNDLGQVVGQTYDPSAGYQSRAVLWNGNDVVALGTLGGAQSGATAINDLGQIVGWANKADGARSGFLINPEDSDGNRIPDRWFRDFDANGANDLMIELPIPGQGAVGINNNGQIIGSTDGGESYLWTPTTRNGPAGSFTPLDFWPSAINDAGQVAGTDYVADTCGNYLNHAVLWQGGVMTDLGYGIARDINASGQVVGFSEHLSKGFIWTPATSNGRTGSFRYLDSLFDPNLWAGPSTYIASDSLGLNNNGQVVGKSTIIDTGGWGEGDSYYQREDAAIWSEGGAKSLPGGAGVAINDARQVIVDLFSGTVGFPSWRSFLLTPKDEPAMSIGDVTIAEGNKGTANAVFTVTLSAASNESVTVNYAAANGTATAGSDYTATSGTLTFAPGETNKSIAIPVKGDRIGEPSETFLVNLSSPTNATLADGQGVGTIVDDEPQVSISDVSMLEGKKGTTRLFTFTVTLSAAYDQPVTVSFKTVNGTAKTSGGDYVGKTGTLTFASGETTKTIAITVKGDSTKESDETFFLDLFGLSSNALFTKKRGIGTILNDD